MKAIIEEDGSVYGISNSELLESVKGKTVKSLSDSQESQLKHVVDSNFDKESFDKAGRGFYEFYAKRLVFENGEFALEGE